MLPLLLLGQGDAVVEPQEVGRLAGGRLVLDQHHEVVDPRGELVGDLVQGGVDEPVELLGRDLQRHVTSLTVAGKETTKRPGPHGPGRSVATPTGLEPAASAVTGRRANQLRYGARRLCPQPWTGLADEAVGL